MQTYSHLIITAALDVANKHGIEKKYHIKVDSWALLLGSFLPDIPLFILSLIYFVEQGVFSGDFVATPEIFGATYDALYFNDFFWIVGHSLFHSPIMIAVYAAIGYWFGLRKGQTWARLLFWFAVGAGLHSFLDIFTHHDDGPLLLFPLNWTWRFSSPVSYWDIDHYATIFAPIEHLIDLVLIGWLVRRRFFNTDDNKSNTQTE